MQANDARRIARHKMTVTCITQLRMQRGHIAGFSEIQLKYPRPLRTQQNRLRVNLPPKNKFQSWCASLAIDFGVAANDTYSM